MPLNPGPHAPCSCGERIIRRNTAEKHGDRVHRHGGLCYDLVNNRDKEPKVDFLSYVRKPFVVQAVEVTRENIAEVAKHVGDLRAKDDGTPYILVDKRLVPNVDRVYPGYFMTKMGENVRCYSKRIFTEQFTLRTDEIQPWLDFLAGKSDDAAAAPAS